MLVLLFGLQCTIEFVELYEALISSAWFDKLHTYQVWQGTYQDRGPMVQLHFLTLSFEVGTVMGKAICKGPHLQVKLMPPLSLPKGTLQQTKQGLVMS